MVATAEERDVLFNLNLSLPRDARYVGLLRNVTACIFEDLGAPTEAADDIELALTEACANAVRHAIGTAEYTVGVTIDADGCEIEVADLGPGFEPPIDEGQDPDFDTETGRGLLLMRALVDDLEFTRHASAMSVLLRKRWPGMGLAVASRHDAHQEA